MKLDIQRFSGGSYNYACYTIENEYVGRMCDKELDDLMKDLATLCHTLEWWQSGDESEEDYREELKKFKEKWFIQERNDRLTKYIDESVDKLKKELHELVGDIDVR